MADKLNKSDLNQVSTIGRAVDPSYLTNRLILILTAVGFGVSFLWGLIFGKPFRQAGLLGVRAGLGLFLAWALTRELDPDREWAAFAAAAFFGVGLVLFGTPELGLVFWALLAIRVVNHTTGLSASLLDSLGLIGLGGWLSYRGNWGLGGITALVLFTDAYLAQGKKRQAGLGVLCVLLVGAIFLFGEGSPPFPGFDWVPAAAAGAAAVLYAPVIAASRKVESTCDQTGDPMLPRRVQAGQVISLIIGLELVFWHGWEGITGVLPLWSAAVGSLVFRSGLGLFRRIGAGSG